LSFLSSSMGACQRAAVECEKENDQMNGMRQKSPSHSPLASWKTQLRVAAPWGWRGRLRAGPGSREVTVKTPLGRAAGEGFWLFNAMI
jgi:hypothetical protein